MDSNYAITSLLVTMTADVLLVMTVINLLVTMQFVIDIITRHIVAHILTQTALISPLWTIITQFVEAVLIQIMALLLTFHTSSVPSVNHIKLLFSYF